MNNKNPEIGDIILIDFNPQIGIETASKRPALVVSRGFFALRSNLVWVCPISSTIKNYPTHVCLDAATKTQGEIKVSQIRALDYQTRGWKFLEKAPMNIVMQVKHIINAITSVNDSIANQ